MVASLRAVTERRGLSRAELGVMDAEHLALRDRSFDAVFCAFGLVFFLDRQRALEELRRVLRPGGLVGVSVWAAEADPRWEWLSHLVARPGGALQPEQPATPEAVAQDLRGAGFAGVWVERHTVDLRYADVREWLGWSWSCGFRVVFERLSAGGLERLAELAGPRIEAAREADGFCHRRLTALFGFGRAKLEPWTSGRLPQATGPA